MKAHSQPATRTQHPAPLWLQVQAQADSVCPFDERKFPAHLWQTLHLRESHLMFKYEIQKLWMVLRGSEAKTLMSDINRSVHYRKEEKGEPSWEEPQGINFGTIMFFLDMVSLLFWRSHVHCELVDSFDCSDLENGIMTSWGHGGD